MLLPFLAVFIIVTIYITIRRSASTRSEQKLWDDFRQREQEANWTRKQDISNLAYIKLPLDTLPLGRFQDETLASYESALRDLATQPICNLNGISNTDLKLRYGAANLNALSQCDTNYSTLVSLLANYGEKLFELSHPEEAKQVLEYALSLDSDVGKTYELLATIYEYEGQPEKIDALYKSAEKITSIRRNSILRKLEEHRNAGAHDGEMPDTPSDRPADAAVEEEMMS
ncbi:MAG: hypothetical protein MR020_09925 [Lachnospiraceae bacterium]|nr:hypothetical protein [Lachnospiraceae bacterium]